MRYFLLYIYKLTVHTIYLSLRLQTWNRDSALFFIMAIDFVFPALTYGEKANFHVNHEQNDSKWYVNNFRLSVNKEADRFKSRPSFPRKSLFNGRAKRSMGKVIFYATIDRRTLPILRRYILTLRNISSSHVIKASSLLLGLTNLSSVLWWYSERSRSLSESLQLSSYFP